MNNSLFTSIPVQKPRRNFFDLSHQVLMTCDMGRLIPTFWMECYPGDSIRVGCSMLLKFAPLIAPIMGANINWYVHYFFVPYRVLWDNFEKYLKSPTNVTADPDPVFPYFIYSGELSGERNKFDYLGCPPIGINNPANEVRLQALPVFAYEKICVDYYLDQNQYDLDDAGNFPVKAVDGDNSSQVGPNLHRRAWKKDYFTSALPFAQKGPQVNLPLTFADIPISANIDPGTTPAVTWATTTPAAGSITIDSELSPEPGMSALYANTSELTGGPSINDLRASYRLQEFLERMSRGGTRGTEIIRSVWGVTPPDYRLQRAEYITGARGPVVISEVLNTSGQVLPPDAVETPLPQGNMSGHGMSVGSSYGGKYFATEHGILMGIMSIIPEANYKDGINSTFLAKGDAIDSLAWPQFGNLGEQPIKNVELYADLNTEVLQNGTFGYTPRYAQYKFMPNRVCGNFRSSLAYWTMFRDLNSDGTLPIQLNAEFIECNPGKDIFAVDDGQTDSIYAHIFHSVKTKRCFPKFGVPVT